MKKKKLFSPQDIEMLKKYEVYLPFFVLGAVVILSVSPLVSQVKKMQSLRARNKAQEKKNDLLKERISQINSFSDQTIDDQIKVSLQALPRLKDPTLALSAVKTLILKNNLLIDRLTFSPGKIAKEEEKKTSAREKVDKVAITAQVSGQTKNILSLVKDINHCRPLVALNGISFDFLGPLEKANLSLEIYFSPVAVKEVGEKENVLPTTKEKKVYETIASFEEVGRGIEVKKGDFVPSDKERDPFSF